MPYLRCMECQKQFEVPLEGFQQLAWYSCKKCSSHADLKGVVDRELFRCSHCGEGNDAAQIRVAELLAEVARLKGLLAEGYYREEL